MIEVALMIEGQNGLNWSHWKNIVHAAEDLGFVGLYRSDHYTNNNPPDKDSLELWVSLTWLADNTSTLDFGPLVSPMSFRHPTFTARMASAVDDLSNGRLTLGLGAGWQEREHNNYGWELLDVPDRFQRFEEGIQVITSLLNSDEVVNFEGDFYRLNDAILLPRPQRSARLPILIGGNGEKRTLPLVAKYADEWNAIFISPEKFVKLNGQLDQLIRSVDRQPSAVRRSLMTGIVYGKNPGEVEEKVSVRTKGQRSAQQLRERGVIVGTIPEIHDQLQGFEDAGVQRVMLQWLDLDDLDGLEAMAQGLFSG